MSSVMKLKEQNWKLRGAMAAGVGGGGGLVAIGSVLGFGHMITRHVDAPVFVAVALLSAGLAGFLLGPLMGRSGWRGALLSFVAFFGATIMGAYVAGALALPFRDIGLVTVWLLFNFFTPFFILWLLICAGLHWSGHSLRRRFT
ncbi:hypothetical protein [Lentibacter sp. XHP0401]|uniref:hypothetical protein n=1 Tax=Lentibacter sp. XHP0401 TaxID=2984334 RepID=UPI0021E80A9D|nr:hypothetical protein [Lentibacter sp. XHP0401]MCV2891655.1 hypothetical protein [Lentibacter sp. XHP0401]